RLNHQLQQILDQRTDPWGIKVTSVEVKHVDLPPDMQRAMARIWIIVPITIVVIFLLLISSFSSIKQAALIILNLPFALIGGIVALWVTGEYVSVPASIGIINLFGVAVLNGIVLVSYMNSLRQQSGMDVQQAVLSGCVLRLRPVLMTALVALLGLVPLALSTGIGSEVQRPLAVVVIGGLVSSTFLTLVVLPVLYQWIEERFVVRSPSKSITHGH
ncbi:MAG: efflux RND transporter permease subunit, partial [Nitrospirales bacterium]